MPLYPQYHRDLATAAAVYRASPQFPPAYEADYLKNLGEALDELSRDPRLFTPTTRAALTQQVLDNFHFADDFKRLGHKRILIKPVFETLIRNIRFSKELTTGFLTLHAERLLLAPDLIATLAHTPWQAPMLAQGFVALKKAGLDSTPNSMALRRSPQLMPCILLLQQKNLLTQERFKKLHDQRALISDLELLLTELSQGDHLNEDTCTQALKAASWAAPLSLAAKELRLAGLLKANFSSLLQNRNHCQALSEGCFNFNYAQVPLTQSDFNLLLQFAPKAKPLSLVMIYLNHHALLPLYRPILASQGQNAELLLRLFEKLQERKLFTPENIAGIFRHSHSLHNLLQACESQPSLTQPVFDRLLGSLRAEHRLNLTLGNSQPGTGLTLFDRQQAPGQETKPTAPLNARPGW